VREYEHEASSMSGANADQRCTDRCNIETEIDTEHEEGRGGGGMRDGAFATTNRQKHNRH